MADKVEYLTTNDMTNMNTSKAEVDKYVSEAKGLNEKAKEYTDLAQKVKDKTDMLKPFLGEDAKKKHAGATSRKDQKYLDARKELTALVEMGKKAVAALKQAKEKFEKDALKEAHVDALKQAKAKLDELVKLATKHGPDSAHLKKLHEEIKNCGDLNAKIESCKANVGKVTKEFKDFVNTNANLVKLVPLAKAAVEQIVKDNAKPWTVECDADVLKAAEKMSCKALPRVMADMKTMGLDAGGLRQIVENKVYDVWCSNSSDDRWVGEADVANRKFKFVAHYDHKAGGGKALKVGKAVGGYTKKG